MKRRAVLRYTGSGILAAIGSVALKGILPVSAAAGGVTIKALGHTCFLFTGGGLRALVNPFRPIGCTAGYRAPKQDADLVMISSRLFDEGVIEEVKTTQQILFEPGVYELKNTQIQGIRTDHDREGGRRFGINVAWRWTQGGIKILHLGGAAAPITFEQKVLMGRPDVLFLPVGGGPKAYSPQEAVQAMQTLNPRLVIPTHYRTQAANAETCDLVSLDDFLAQIPEIPVRRANDSISLSSGNLPDSGPVIQVLSYAF